MDDLSPTKPQP
jgi:hypothetical protein